MKSVEISSWSNSCILFCIVLTDYLEAQRARINDLRVAKWTTEGADVAYHLNLTESSKRRPDLEEGDVIAFLTNRNTGQTEIEKLTHENSARAVLAGVISRSAYIYAHAPRHSSEKGNETTRVHGIFQHNCKITEHVLRIGQKTNLRLSRNLLTFLNHQLYLMIVISPFDLEVVTLWPQPMEET